MVGKQAIRQCVCARVFLWVYAGVCACVCLFVCVCVCVCAPSFLHILCVHEFKYDMLSSRGDRERKKIGEK